MIIFKYILFKASIMVISNHNNVKMARKRLIAANWKMHKTNTEAEESAVNLKVLLANIKDVDILICPPFTALYSLASIFTKTNIMLGAQNMHFEKQGAFSGEISGAMLQDLGVDYVILGHSERRHIFNEGDEMINRKVIAALASDLKPILCIGETLKQMENDETFKILESQLTSCLKTISKGQAKKITIAYEPVWAIGTGKNDTPEGTEEVHKFIRKLLNKLYDKDTAENIRILYGGSVKPFNAKVLIDKTNIDGLLVGGASLEPATFAEIVSMARL